MSQVAVTSPPLLLFFLSKTRERPYLTTASSLTPMLPPPTPQLFTPPPTPSTMGRTKTQRKRKQRIKEIEEDQHDTLVAGREEAVQSAKSDADLFVIDRVGGSEAKAAKKSRRGSNAASSSSSSAVVAAAASSGALVEVDESRPKRAASKRQRALQKSKARLGGAGHAVARAVSTNACGEPVLDAWGDEPAAGAKKSKKKAAPKQGMFGLTEGGDWDSHINGSKAVMTAAGKGNRYGVTTARRATDKRKRVVKSTAYAVPAVEVAGAGSSYNPDKQLHQEAIAHAVAEELERAEKKRQAQTLPTGGLPKDLIVDIDGSSSEEEEEEEEEAGAAGVKKALKPLVDRLKKKTTADRNRAKAHKARLAIAAKLRREKDLSKEIDQARATNKQVKEKRTEGRGENTAQPVLHVVRCVVVCCAVLCCVVERLRVYLSAFLFLLLLILLLIFPDRGQGSGRRGGAAATAGGEGERAANGAAGHASGTAQGGGHEASGGAAVVGAVR